MEHVAILRKSSRLLELIISGKKTIESRWYESRYAPWNRIQACERIYFKNSGEFVNVAAQVATVLQFTDLNEQRIKDILKKYGKQIGIASHKSDSFFQKIKNKKYCILIFLEKVTKIEPFSIDKTGFGMMAAWLCVEDIGKIRRVLG